MSLDIYLHSEKAEPQPPGSGIFVREDGCVREITREEWDAKFPGLEPLVAIPEDETRTTGSNEVFFANITHNLVPMAIAAKLYDYLWRVDNDTVAATLIPHLETGLDALLADPEKFKKHNPANGWGNYDVFVNFVKSVLKACKDYPGAKVSVHR